MDIDDTGRRPAFAAVTRAGLLSAALLVGLGLSACTTVEGTNALTDPVTFEREVMTATAQGLGLVPRQAKEETNVRRAPLVLPKDTTALPLPTEAQTAALPVDSDTVQIDASNLSAEDLRRLRNARVVDARTLGGRPLTEAETRALTARMSAANMAQLTAGKRPLYLPPDEYFTTVAGKDTVCLATDGELVPLSDPKCPPEIRKALSTQ